MNDHNKLTKKDPIFGQQSFKKFPRICIVLQNFSREFGLDNPDDEVSED